MRQITQPFKISEYGDATKGIVFIFGGWRMAKLFYLPGIKRMNSLGFKCILFRPNAKLIAIGTPYQEIVEAAWLANQKVTNYIETALAKDADSHFISMGGSFGTLFAMYVAKQQATIHKIILLAPFGDFEKHVTLWQNNLYFGKIVRSQPTAVIESGKVLNQAGAAVDLGKLKGKEIHLYYGKRDKTIHASVAEEFLTLLKAEQISVTVRAIDTGHLRSIFKNYAYLMKNGRSFFS